jgi:hypothetical protein
MPVDLPHDRVILVTDLRRPRRTDDRLTDCNRHRWDTGSAGFSRSTSARRCARSRIKSRGFVPKKSFSNFNWPICRYRRST